MQNSQNYNKTQPNRRSRNGKIDIDYVPKDGKTEDSRDFKGGEYVDYEEVKE